MSFEPKSTFNDFDPLGSASDIDILMEIINDIRVRVWKQQPPAFFEGTARIDADETLVETTGECKQGMDMRADAVEEANYRELVRQAGEVLAERKQRAKQPVGQGGDHP